MKFNFFVILWYNNIDTQKRLVLTKRRHDMTYKDIFKQWNDDLPPKRKVQVAEQLLLISGSNNKLTPEEKKIVEEAEKFLLQRDD